MPRGTLKWFPTISLLLAVGCGRSGPPYAPREALTTFRIQPGYKIELFAAEPDIVDPVAMEIDEAGRVYVVTSSGYPLDTAHKGSVRLLVDTNGDGRHDRATMFADNLQFPTGVMRWKNGILITDPPDVLYLEDADGDGKAEIRRVVLTGFAQTNPQHTVNNPIYGLDNWIHLANEFPSRPVIFTQQFSDTGSDLRFPDRPDIPPLAPRGRSIRFRPETHQIERHAGTSQFGHDFDDWGRYFTLNNSNHLRHEVIAARYLERNPDLPAAGAMQDISDHGNAAEVYPITKNPRYEMLTEVGGMTSACGLRWFQNAAFIAEPVYNVVHRDLWAGRGASFSARRAYERSEFLASTDSWFRPVNFYVGPDGALYVLDYYRLSIEHPEWMSTETHKSPDLYKGAEMGRIYRIVPDAGAPLRPVALGAARDEDLVAQLSSPSPWWRRTAQRLLIDRKRDAGLAQLALSGATAVGRLHALWTLEGLGKLDATTIERALADPEPGVRENAIILSEPRLGSTHALVAKLLTMAGDTDARVKFQLLCTLGFVDSPAARAARDRLLSEQMDDRWMQLAALSASSEEAVRLFGKGPASFLSQTAAVIGARRKPAEIEGVLRKAGTNAAVLDGLAAGLRGRRGVPLGGSQAILLRVLDSEDVALRRSALRVLDVAGLAPGPATEAALQHATVIASDVRVAPERRADALGLLALGGAAPREAMLKSLLSTGQPEAVQAAAVQALGKIPGEEIGRFLLVKWASLTGPVRSAATDALLLDPGRQRLLVEAIRSGLVHAWQMSFRQKRQLLMHRDPALREASRALLEPKAGEREKVLARYAAALETKGDVKAGRIVFDQVCAKCHKWNGTGAEVGPDLVTVRNRSHQILLEDILNPNKSIAQDYEAYIVETVDGATLDGVLGPQTSASITLRHEDGKQDEIPRSRIRSMRASTVSNMPADLEQQVSIRQMADLLEFLTAGR